MSESQEHGVLVQKVANVRRIHEWLACIGAAEKRILSAFRGPKMGHEVLRYARIKYWLTWRT